MTADVIVIGAGAAGLMAAQQLAGNGKNVLVLEARHRVGGRIYTLSDPAFQQPVECGAEFVHGKLELTLKLLKEAGLQHTTAEGEIWRSQHRKLFQQEDFVADYDVLMKQLKQQEADTPVGTFLDTHFADPQYLPLRTSIKSYVEGYYAGDLYKASTLALREELQKSDEEQYRVEGGYGQLVDYLYRQCLQHGCTFQLSTIAQQINWRRGHAEIITNTHSFTAEKVIIAVPLGVLKDTGIASSIQFEPQLLQKTAAVHEMGFGPTIKVLLQFDAPFWKNEYSLKNLNFIFSDEEVPTWWTQHPKENGLLTGWCAGEKAAALQHLRDEEIVAKAVQSLTNIFTTTPPFIQQKLLEAKVCNWAADPFTQGGYAYITVATERAIETLAEPEEDTLYFTGEALQNGPEIGTVEAALQSGKRTARAVLDHWK